MSNRHPVLPSRTVSMTREHRTASDETRRWLARELARRRPTWTIHASPDEYPVITVFDAAAFPGTVASSFTDRLPMRAPNGRWVVTLEDWLEFQLAYAPEPAVTTN